MGGIDSRARDFIAFPLVAMEGELPDRPKSSKYASGSVESRLLADDPAAVGEISRWISNVLASSRFWLIRSEWVDLHQEIFLRVVESLRCGRYDPTRDLKTYVQAVARYTGLSALENHRRFFRTSLQELPGTDVQLSSEQHAIASQLVRLALEKASDECRKLILAYFLKERSYTEIAQDHDLPVGTIKSRLFRCLRSAQRALSRGSGPEPGAPG